MTPEEQEQLDNILGQYSTPVLSKERSVWPKALLYGRPKIGKTKTACEVGEKPLLLSADGGWTVLKDWPELNERIQVDELQSLKHFKLWVQAVVAQTPRYREYDHYIIDPMNVIQGMYTHDYLQTRFSTTKQGENRTSYTPTREGTADGELAFTTAGMSDYNATVTFFRPLVFQLCRLPKMVTFICHAKEPGITEGKGTPMRAAMPKETYALFAQFVDFIGYMEAVGTNITISVSPSEKEDAGSRIRAIHGKKITAKDYPLIIEKWRIGELSGH